MRLVILMLLIIAATERFGQVDGKKKGLLQNLSRKPDNDFKDESYVKIEEIGSRTNKNHFGVENFYINENSFECIISRFYLDSLKTLLDMKEAKVKVQFESTKFKFIFVDLRSFCYYNTLGSQRDSRILKLSSERNNFFLYSSTERQFAAIIKNYKLNECKKK